MRIPKSEKVTPVRQTMGMGCLKEGEVLEYAFCESVLAGGSTPWHIRRLGSAGLKRGGGIDTPSLCEWVRPIGDNTPDRKGLGGWDLNVRITDHHLSHCCKDCAVLYRKATNT